MDVKQFRMPFSNNNKAIRDMMPGILEILEKDIKDKAYGFVFYEEKIIYRIHVGCIESSNVEKDRGMVLRLVFNGKNYESASNSLDKDNLIILAQTLNKQVKSLDEKIQFPVYKPASWSEEKASGLIYEIGSQIPDDVTAASKVHFSPMIEKSPLDYSLEELIQLARQTRETVIVKDKEYSKAANTKPVALVNVNMTLKVMTQIFVDKSKNMSQTLPICHGRISSQTWKGKSHSLITGGLGGIETYRYTTGELESVYKIPHELDNAQFLKPGNYPVITGPDVTGVIAHEAFGHTQEADTYRQGRSITAIIQDQPAGNELATIINNAALFSSGKKEYGTNASYYFDQEGELARSTVILDKGKLGLPMTDLLSAIHLGIRRTANGKRESWRRPTYDRQTNTYFPAGNKTLEELISMIKGTGFLAVKAYGGMEDPKGANLTAGTSYFEEIVDGFRTGRFFIGPRGGHIELSGNAIDILKGIRACSKVYYESCAPDPGCNPLNESGGCAKYHKESVSAGAGGPYILWESIGCG